MHERSYNISQEFIAACNLLDVAPERVLAQMGLPAKSAQAACVSLSAQQVAMVFGLIVAEYGRDDFHIKLADGFARAAFGNAFLALHCSENLGKGIRRVARFKLLIEPVEWSITETDKTFCLRLQSLSEYFPLVGIGQIMSFLWLVKSCRNLSARQVVPKRVCITDAVPHQAEIEKELGCPIEIAPTPLMEFAPEVMAYPVLSANRYVASALDTGMAANKIRWNTAHDDQFIAAVYAVIVELLPSGVVTLERVAGRLALSKRTLVRRLADQGHHFTEILHDCRRDRALHYLRDTPLPINEIALLLGYREINSFYRSFKEWFGTTPQAIRTGQAPPAA